MIQSKIFFAVKCDCCGDLYEGEDYSYWPTAGDVESYAQDGDWITHEGGHVCPDCYEIGDDDEIVLLKPFVKPEIEKPKTDLQRFKDLFDSVGVGYVEDNHQDNFLVYLSVIDHGADESGALFLFFKDGRIKK